MNERKNRPAHISEYIAPVVEKLHDESLKREREEKAEHPKEEPKQ